ncbi:LysE family translocator [Actinoallomurus sp. CA-150999]|uniref:LysE family translocator n=1 Tax=Actinoallomurus sp. CA-150999 TaxID=3239887 RepID=UPI003D8A5BE8
MGEVIWLGVLLGAGAALSVGPIFVTILNEAATRGFGPAFRVILGSAVADVVLLLPALAFAWVIAAVAQATLWVALVGAAFFLWLAGRAGRDAVRLWRKETVPEGEGWAFWKGVAANLANPLTWTFWLATGTPAMLRAQHLADPSGLVVFTVTWFVVASGLEAVVALVVARSGRRLGHRGQGAFTGLSAALFAVLAALMLARAAAS